jgi:hypothetical protein
MQMADVATQALQAAMQQQQQSQQEQQVPGWTDTAPTLWGSAALQALDYAVLNGAHIVLAAWQAGLPVMVEDDTASPAAASSSSTPNSNTAAPVVTATPGGSAPAAAAAAAEQAGVSCVLGGAAAAAAGLTNSRGPPGSAVCAAALKHLFADALTPLDKAGVLLVTLDQLGTPRPVTVASGSAGAAGGDDGSSRKQPPQLAALPCALAGSFSNVLCVNAVDAVAEHDLADSTSATTYFEALIKEPGGFGTISNSSSSSTPTVKSTLPSPASVMPQKLSNSVEAEEFHVPLQQSTSRAGSSSSSSSNRSSSDSRALGTVTAPGSLIRAGWSWGSHAVVSGGSAAAAVAAGAAALTWSNLGQALGGDASAGAFEGLGQMVRQLMLDAASNTNTSTMNNTNASSSSSDSSSSSAGWKSSPAQLDLLQAVQQSSKPTGQSAPWLVCSGGSCVMLLSAFT